VCHLLQLPAAAAGAALQAWRAREAGKREGVAGAGVVAGVGVRTFGR